MMKQFRKLNQFSALIFKGFLCVLAGVLRSSYTRFDLFCNLRKSFEQEKNLRFKKGNFQSKILFPGASLATYNQLNNQSVNRKTGSDTIHEMYLATIRVIYLVILFSILAGLSWIAYKVYQYFQNNTIQEMGMDFLIIALPLVLAYSIYKQVKRVRGNQ